MREYEISIIIPVYNEEKNLAQCIEGLYLQTSKAFELIFIDDGSTDTSVSIINNYIIQYPDLSIKLIQQKNSGAAAARQAGVAQCINEYIMQLDCDDQIAIDAIEAVINQLQQHSADIVLFNLEYEVLEKGVIRRQPFEMFKTTPFTAYEAFLNSIDGWGVHGYGCFSKALYEQAYAEYARYNKEGYNYLNNDEVITRILFFYAQSIEVCQSTYTYKYNVDSTTKKLNPNKHNIIRNSVILFAFVTEHDSNAISLAARSLMSTIWGVCRYLIENKDKLENKAEWIQSIQIGMQYIAEHSLYRQFDLKRKIQFLLVKLLAIYKAIL
ncbi:glycosyltransferase family 2 protein [Acinetobacter rudis]|uniref:Glycosyltransferase family 2 protein n=1 Tax=Acinetobacter rudis TaxID=632955 RepID=A0AAW8J9U3_9GAMM|nr:glycosyltransferase family 2 protein [Acinetobacter rudis]MDQ8935924.1 glycosyltransferase family 2 protein [Acinetobacter rudis]MDQ8953631.1 glycosyltransferase family 2 protein [Acinetobacter rudis]MDQ9018187.1 glycosyltransferase family 2 protein [Acinetobacter rudis]